MKERFIPAVHQPLIGESSATHRRLHRAAQILGVEAAESEALLSELCEHMEQDRFRCRFRWRPDSVAFWDNRLTQHRPVNDYWPEHRKLQRITIDGDRPFYRPQA